MPWIVVGLGSLAITGMSFIKDILRETDTASDDVNSMMLNATLLIIAGAGVYMLAKGKIKIG